MMMMKKLYLCLLASLLIAPASAQNLPVGATAVAVSAVGTTGIVTATMPVVTSQTNWLCGFSIRSTATTGITGDATVTGPTNTLHFTQAVGAAPAAGLVQENFNNPCITATSVSTAIAVNSIAAGTAGVTSVTVWGYVKP
jgi:hypothetical protein